MPIALENVSHVYAPGTPWQVEALRDVSLTVADGEAIGIIGATGSGKSTLIQHFNGLLRPTSGRVLVDGQPLWQGKRADPRLRLQTGIVFQYPEQQLFEETVRADIAFGPRNLGLSEDEVERRVHQALAQVGLPPALLDRSPFELSGGQQRRVAIAGVLAMRPKRLVLDEPTAGLDPQSRRMMMDLLQTLRREQGLTLIMVSHNMDEISRIADRVLIMQRGRIRIDAPVDQAYREAGLLRELGLDLPFPARLVEALNARGWSLPPSLLREADVADAVAAALDDAVC